MATYDYSKIGKQIRAEVESSINKELSEIDMAKIFNEVISHYHIDLGEIDINSESFKFLLAKTIKKVFNTATKEIPDFEIDLSDFIDLDEKQLNKQVELLYEDITDALDKGQSDLAKSFQNDFVKAIATGLSKGYNIIDKMFGEYADLIGKNKNLHDLSTAVIDKIDQMPKSFSDLTKFLTGGVNEKKSKKITRDYWNSVLQSFDQLDQKTKDLLKSFGLLNKEGNLTVITDGANNFGGIVGKINTALTKISEEDGSFESVNELKERLDEAYQSGVQCARILEVIDTGIENTTLQLQETAKGKALSASGNAANNFMEVFNPTALKASDDQIIKLYQDVKKLWELGLEPDLFNTSNLIYDNKNGFTLIDISKISGKYESLEDLWQDFIRSIQMNVEDYSSVDIDVSNMLKKFSTKIMNASRDLGEALTKGYRKGIDAHSDSREAIAATDDFANGIIDEAQERAGDVEASGEDLGKSFVKGYNKGTSEGETDESLQWTDGIEDKLKQAEQSIESYEQKVHSLVDELTQAHEEIDRLESALSDEKANSDYGWQEASNEHFEKLELQDKLEQQERFIKKKEEEIEGQQKLKSLLEDELSSLKISLETEKERSKFRKGQINDYIRQVVELESRLNNVSTEQGVSSISHDLTGFLEILEKISSALEDISKALGKIDDNSGINNIVTSLDSLLTKLNEVAGKVGTGIYNIKINKGGDKEAIASAEQLDNYIRDTRARYQNAFAKIVEKAGGEENLFTHINTALNLDKINLVGGREGLSESFSSLNVGKLRTAEEQIKRLMDFFGILRQAIDSPYMDLDFKKALKGTRLPSADDKLFRQNIRNKSIKNNSEADMAAEDTEQQALNQSVEKLQLVIEKLEEIKVILKTIGENNPLEESFKHITELVNSLLEKFKAIENSNLSNKLIETNTELQDEKNKTAELEKQVQLLQEQAELNNERFTQSDNEKKALQETIENLKKQVKLLREIQEESVRAGKSIQDSLVYRGTNGEDPVTINKLGATFWSSVKENAKQYGTEGVDKTLFSSLISMQNALEIDAKGSKYAEITYLGDGATEASKQIIALTDHAEECRNELNELRSASENDTDAMQRAAQVATDYSETLRKIKEISDDLNNPYGTHSTDWFAEWAKNHGYDGLHVKNVQDTPDSYAKDVTPSDIYATFQREQLKNIQLLEKANHSLIDVEQEQVKEQHEEQIALSETSEEVQKETNEVEKIVEEKKEELNVEKEITKERKKRNSGGGGSNGNPPNNKNKSNGGDDDPEHNAAQAYYRISKSEQRYQNLLAKQNDSQHLKALDQQRLTILQQERDLYVQLIQASAEYSAKYANLQKITSQNAQALIKDEQVDKFIKKYQKLYDLLESSKYTKASKDEVTKRFAEENMPSIDTIDAEDIDAVKHYNSVLDELINKTMEKLGNETKLRKTISDITKTMMQNSAMSSELADKFDELRKRAELFASSGDFTADTVKDITNRFIELNTELVKSGKTGRSFLSMIGNDIVTSSARIIAQYFGIQDLIRYTHSAISAVQELDTALTQLKIVSGATESELKRVADSAYEMANSLGLSTTEITNSITEWRRLGKTVEEAKILTEQAARLSTGGMMDISSATTSLISSMQAFEMGAEDVSKVVDQYIYLGNNYAISSEQLATSLTKSMAALKVAGNSLEQIEALEVAGNTIVQDADAVSNSLKVLSMRLRGTTGSALEEVGEDTEGLIEDFSKLNNKIRDLTKTVNNPEGVTIVDKMTGGYKSTYQILLEISKVWKDIGDMQKAELLEIMAGKVRATAAAAILESPEILESAYIDAMQNSAGAGEAAVEASIDSIEKRFNIFKNNMSQAARNLFESNAVKDVLQSLQDFSADLAQNVDKYTPLVNLVKEVLIMATNLINGLPAGGIIGAVFGIKNINGQLGKNIVTGMFNKAGWAAPVTEEDVQLYQKYLDLKADDGDWFEAYGQSMSFASRSAQNLAYNLEKEGVSSEVAMIRMQQATRATKEFTIASKALNVALSMIASVLITQAVSALSEWIHAEENARRATTESLQAQKQRREEFEKQQATLDDIIAKYKDYQEQLKNTNKTEEDVANIRSGLADLQKTLNEQYGETAKQLDLVNGKYETQLELLKLIGDQSAETWLANEEGAYKKALKEARTKINGYDYDLGFQLELQPSIDGDDFNEAMYNMLKRGGFDAQLEYTGEEFYDAIQNVLRYYKDNITDKYYNTFEEFEQIWSEYYQKDGTDLSNIRKAEEEVRGYEKVAALASQYADEYQELEKIIANAKADLSSGKYFNAMAYSFQTNAISGASQTVRNAFQPLLKELNNIQQQAQIEYNKQKGNYLIMISDALTNYYKETLSKSADGKSDKEIQSIIDAKLSGIKQYIDGYAIDTDEEFQTFLNILEELKEQGLKDISEIFDYYDVRIDMAKEVKKISYSDWLDEKSNFKSGKDSKENLSNNALINAWESTVKGFGEYLEQDEQGQIKIDFGKIIQFTRDDDLVQQLGLDTFESYMKKYGESTTAIFAYVFDAEKKLKANIDKDFKDQDIFYQTLENIKTEALGGSISVDKLEDSYQELTGILKQVEDEIKFDKEKMTALINKYPELKSAVKKYSDDSYSLQKENLENLIDTYIEFENTAISTQLQLKRYTLETIIATANLGVTVEQLASSYASILNEDGSKKVDVSGHDYEYIFGDLSGTGKSYQEVEKAVQDYNEIREKALRQLRETIGSSDKNDKDNSDKNKSEFDWLDSYLDKRARAIQVLEQQNETLANFDPIVQQLEEYSKGGTVNLKLRPEIDAEELNKQGWEAGEGFATVFSSTFSNESGDLAINFTPIIVDPKTGEYKGVLTPDELTDYAMGVIEGTREDDLNLQIGAEFTGKNAIKQAEKAAIKIHKLHEQLHEGYDIEEEYYKSLNNNLKQTNKAIEEEIKALGKAQKERQKRMSEGLLYDNAVKAFGSEAEAKKVIAQVKKQYEAEGRYDLKEYTSEQQSALSAIMDVYTKYLDDTNKIAEDKSKIAENNLKIYQNKIEEITQAYDHILKEFEMRETQLNHYQTMLTNQGMMENQQYYLAMLDNESRKLEANMEKRNDLLAQLNKLETTNKAGTDKWWETKEAIDECTKAMWESEEAAASLDMSMTKLGWDLDDRIMDIKKGVTDETNFLIDTLSALDTDMYQYTREFLGNDAEKIKIFNGQMSEAGLSTLALRRTNLQAWDELIRDYNTLVDNAEKDYLSNTANVEKLDRLNTLKKERNDMIKSLNDERQAIVDLVNDGYQKQLQSLDALSSKYMDILNSQKAIYDFQKNVEKQTKNINNLRKQITAYANDSSEEARGKLQQLKVQLEEAEEERGNTEYEHRLQDQQQILDQLYQSLEDYFNDKLEDPTSLISDTKDLVNDNLPEIKNYLQQILAEYHQEVPETIANTLGADNVTGNISISDGDITAITSSVNNATTNLENYLAQNDISLTDKKLITDRIKDLAYAESSDGVLKANFKRFNKMMEEIDQAILQIDLGNIAERAVLPVIDAIDKTTSAITALQNAGSLLASSMASVSQDFVNLIASPKQTIQDVASNAFNAATNTFNNTMSPTIVLPNVVNANDFISTLQKNKQFESMVQDMTIGLMSGTNSLTKLKYKF